MDQPDCNCTKKESATCTSYLWTIVILNSLILQTTMFRTWILFTSICESYNGPTHAPRHFQDQESTHSQLKTLLPWALQHLGSPSSEAQSNQSFTILNCIVLVRIDNNIRDHSYHSLLLGKNILQRRTFCRYTSPVFAQSENNIYRNRFFFFFFEAL